MRTTVYQRSEFVDIGQAPAMSFIRFGPVDIANKLKSLLPGDWFSAYVTSVGPAKSGQVITDEIRTVCKTGLRPVLSPLKISILSGACTINFLTLVVKTVQLTRCRQQ